MERQPQNEKSQPVPHRNGDRVWEHRLVWLLLLCIAGLFGYVHLMGRVDHKLTAEIVRLLRKEFPSHSIAIDRANLQAGHSITVEGIRIAKPTDQGLRDVVRISRVVCYGPLELIGLVQGQIPVQRVVVDGAEICVWPLSNGKWSIQELSSKKPLHPNMPSIDVRSGMIRLGSETGRSDQEIICHDLRAQVGLLPRVVGQQVMPLVGRLNLSIASSYFSNAQIQANLSEDKTEWSLEGSITKLEYTQRLAAQLPSVLQTYTSQASGFSGEMDVAVAAHSKQGQLAFEMKSQLHNGRLMHPKVPYPLESMSGEIYARNGLIQLRNVRGSSGAAQIVAACDMHGYQIGSPLAASISVSDLPLDQRLLEAMPAAMQEQWRRLGVSGVIDANATFQFDGKDWKPRVVVRAKDAGVEPDFFPYPLKNICGDFVYENDRVVAKELRAVAGDQTLSGALTLTRAQPRWLMDLLIASDGPIAIDESLMRALSPRGGPQSGLHKFVLSLHPLGTVMLKRGHFVRTAERPDTISRSLDLTFSECSIRYDNFRYPITNVNGQATLDNDHLVLRGFTGQNDGARIQGEGVCQCRNSNLESMDLYFKAFGVSLDEELQQALPKGVRNLWDQLQPSGVLDRVAIEIHRNDPNDPLDMRVDMFEDRDLNAHVSRSVAFRPLSIPYAINDVACAISYRPGRVDIHSLSGMHEISRVLGKGNIRLNQDGTWDGSLEWLPSTRLIVDQSLISCLPNSLKDPLSRLDFRGPVSFRGMTRISSPPTPNESIVRDWTLNVEVEDAKFGSVGIASGIRGSVTVTGENTPLGPTAYGLLELDGLSIKNIPVTGLEGPFALDRNELMFGRDAAAWQLKSNLRLPSNPGTVQAADSNVIAASHRTPIRDLLPERDPFVPDINPNLRRSQDTMPVLDVRDNDIRARALSGTIFLSGTEPLDGQRSRYRVRLVDADFHGLLVDLGETNTQAAGRLSVQCDMQGSIMSTTSLEGTGRAWLREANLYELPAMIRLFGLLSVRPEQSAFDAADIDFSIDGDRIPVNEITLDGDLVSMRGSGWVNMRRELHFDLFAHVGRRSLIGALARPITHQPAARLLQIEVNGTTTDPQMKRSIPLIHSLEQVLPENAE